ncbi:MAG: response regulator transcription factor [Erysipelotrichales bacterium]
MYKIICVEDDVNLALQLKEALERFKYEVLLVSDFSNVDKFILDNEPHLVIMDVNLPSNDGFYWTNLIRQHSNVPILFMSSRDERLEQVMAMSIGADDYITKPIDLELTIIKIQALLRRVYDYENSKSSNVLKYNELELDLNKFELRYKDKVDSLTKNEFKILQKLMLHQNEFVKREVLMDYLWDNNSFIDNNAFNVNLSRLRKKIESIYGEDLIETKRSVGYRFG